MNGAHVLSCPHSVRALHAYCFHWLKREGVGGLAEPGQDG